ncbi:hypothetical protein BD289DRAFT_369836 [Coniella lustricola]|uniref:Uncharacterized protein n=1 Tax=Coniella lustricola TaxID=2025994 RepID=A0A2T3A622_9PEZI|nr:hypothetical protein BD289DRAFT_369836 [Coniella lustricola]
MASSEKTEKLQDPWFLRSTHPVFVPAHAALTASEDDFRVYVQQHVKPAAETRKGQDTPRDEATRAKASQHGKTDQASDMAHTAAIREQNDGRVIDTGDGQAAQSSGEQDTNPFMQGLKTFEQGNDRKGNDNNTQGMDRKMLTENGDVAFRSTNQPLVDLFAELEDVPSGPRLSSLLESAWKDDALATLKIIFNARSIHLGKASRHTFYRCAGWLAQNHPRTLLTNLAWLSRPVIQKKAGKPTDKPQADEDAMVIIGEDGEEQGEHEADANDPARFDIKNGVAHGYWKDLLNMLALSVNDHLTVLAKPQTILNVEQEKSPPKCYDSRRRQVDAGLLRHKQREERHDSITMHFTHDAVYRGLHLTVARLFAAQLKVDLGLLADSSSQAQRAISLCAKWAPSLERFHDKHTHIASSIAEILHPLEAFPAAFAAYDPDNVEQRTFYLRHAREAYRKNLAALRAKLAVVERDISANKYNSIKYDRLPSIAMKNYTALFTTKDPVRFEEYIDRVASGQARISGATLVPSTLLKMARMGAGETRGWRKRKQTKMKDILQAKGEAIVAKALDGQWRAMVQRVRDSGTLDNCIAVVDVSGSMTMPVFGDGTCPLDSSVGLGLLMAEVCGPPFGGCFITFSDEPTVQVVDLSLSLREKYAALARAPWGNTTDFVAVFERLILPMAVEKKLKQEDMVKRVFVFSDMQFNAAKNVHPDRHLVGQGNKRDRWEPSSYERIQKSYREAGYEVPELVFWNLAGGAQPGMYDASVGDAAAPKPVDADEIGTAMVSGYSQGMLKVFMENGMFEDDNEGGPEEEEDIVEEIDEDGDVVVNTVSKAKKRKLDPVGLMRRAIGHKSYGMLSVVD